MLLFSSLFLFMNLCFFVISIKLNFMHYTYVSDSSTCVYIIASKSWLQVKYPLTILNQESRTNSSTESNLTLYKISHLNNFINCNHPLNNFKNLIISKNFCHKILEVMNQMHDLFQLSSFFFFFTFLFQINVAKESQQYIILHQKDPNLSKWDTKDCDQ